MMLNNFLRLLLKKSSSIGLTICMANRVFGFQLTPQNLEVPFLPQASASQVENGEVVEELGNNLMTVYQDSKDCWWFATWGDGLYRYDGKAIVHFTDDHGLSHNRTNQILEDSAGILYFNTPSGVSKFADNRFSTLPVSSSSEWKLASGDLWFNSPKFDGNVFRYDGKSLSTLRLPKVAIGERFLTSKSETANPYGVYIVYRDKLDNVWFGTAALGVCRYDGKRFDWLTSEDVNELHNGPANGVRSIIEDVEGYFWFNTQFRYDLSEQASTNPTRLTTLGIFHRLPGIGSLDGKPDGESFEYMSIAKDRTGGLWIATYGDGVYHYDGMQVKHFPILNGTEAITLFSVYCDRSDNIWLGTHSNGAYRYNGKSFERFRPGKP